MKLRYLGYVAVLMAPVLVGWTSGSVQNCSTFTTEGTCNAASEWEIIDCDGGSIETGNCTWGMGSCMELLTFTDSPDSCIDGSRTDKLVEVEKNEPTPIAVDENNQPLSDSASSCVDFDGLGEACADAEEGRGFWRAFSRLGNRTNSNRAVALCDKMCNVLGKCSTWTVCTSLCSTTCAK